MAPKGKVNWEYEALEARKALVQIQKRIDCTPDQPLSSVADLVKKGLEDGKVEA